MATYEVYVFCNECSETHGMQILLPWHKKQVKLRKMNLFFRVSPCFHAGTVEG